MKYCNESIEMLNLINRVSNSLFRNGCIDHTDYYNVIDNCRKLGMTLRKIRVNKEVMKKKHLLPLIPDGWYRW